MILEDICDVYSGYAIKQFNEDKIGVPVIKIGNILMDWTIELEDCQYTTEKVNQKYYSEYQDIYIALSGATTGKIGILKRQEKFIVNQRVGIVRKKDNNIPIEFIKYFLFHHTDRIFKEAAGCAQPNISPKQIGKYKVPIIDDSRMKYVVEILDSLTRIINKRKRQLNYLDELIKARFVEMFGDPVKNTKGWKVKRLGELSIQINSGNTPKGGSNVYVDEGIAFFRSQNVWKDRLEMEDIVYISNDTHASMKRSSLKNGDILMTKTGRINTENSSLGRAALYVGEDDKANVNGHVYFIRLKPEVNNKFILRILVSVEYRDLIRSVCVGGIDKRQLNKEHIENFPIICPPDSLIDKYIELVDHIDKSKVEVKRALDEAQLLFDSLMQKYFG